MTLLEPWILLRLAASLVAVATLGAAAWVALRVLAHRRVVAATEGQLALERQAELAGTLARVGAAAQVLALVVALLAADRLAPVVRGAMCGFGVVAANPWGWPSLAATTVAALGACALGELLAFDARVQSLDLLRPAAVAALVVAPLAALDLGAAGAWAAHLDLSVVASCCSATVDTAAAPAASASGPRAVVTAGALASALAAIALALAAARSPGRLRVALASAVALGALPLALGATMLTVAPYVYEAPLHVCPFCLLRADARFLGWPLYGALLFAAAHALGGLLSAALARSDATRTAFAGFAPSRMRRVAGGLAVALALGAAPVLGYALSSPNASLFR